MAEGQGTPLKPLKIEATKDTPTIHFDAQNNHFEISGRSFPLNAKGFYMPVIEWLERYAENPNEKTNFIFRLEYFNTPSSKSITDILKLLKKMRDEDKDVEVTWYYEEDDVDIMDLGHVFSRTIGIPFDFKEYHG